MRTSRFKAVALATVLVAGAAALPAEAGPRGRVNVWFGGPLWWPGYWSYPVYPVVVNQPMVIPAEPLAVQPSAQQNHLWYYCREAQMYYPYVTSCPSAWQEVPATTPSTLVAPVTPSNSTTPAVPPASAAADAAAPAPATTRTAPAPVPPARQN